MKLYFAPLEGITTYTYRRLHAELFGGCDAYFAPFINPSENEKISMKNLRDIMPERNGKIDLRVQVLTNNAESFMKFEEKAEQLGYGEININLGCPSGTVVHKGRGSGFLKEPEAMDRFFDEIFSKTNLKISVKTRTGYFSGDEMEALMSVYNKYPISELTVHPRARSDFYNGNPDMEVFSKAYAVSKNRVCYNGDVNSEADFRKIISDFSELSGVMLGRGAIANPAIFREIKGGERLKTAELIEFSMRLAEAYYEILKSDLFTLQKLKEIWMYIMRNFPEEKKILKAIKKSNKTVDFKNAINCLPELN